MAIPLIAAGIGGIMGLSTLKRAVQDWMNPDLDDQARAGHERTIREIASETANRMAEQGYGPDDIRAEIESAFTGEIDDGPKVGAGELAMAAAGLIPGVGLARMGASGIKGAAQVGRAMGGGSGLRGMIGAGDEVARQAFRGGVGGALGPSGAAWKAAPGMLPDAQSLGAMAARAGIAR